MEARSAVPAASAKNPLGPTLSGPGAAGGSGGPKPGEPARPPHPVSSAAEGACGLQTAGSLPGHFPQSAGQWELAARSSGSASQCPPAAYKTWYPGTAWAASSVVRERTRPSGDAFRQARQECRRLRIQSGLSCYTTDSFGCKEVRCCPELLSTPLWGFLSGSRRPPGRTVAPLPRFESPSWLLRAVETDGYPCGGRSPAQKTESEERPRSRWKKKPVQTPTAGRPASSGSL